MDSSCNAKVNLSINIAKHKESKIPNQYEAGIECYKCNIVAQVQ